MKNSPPFNTTTTKVIDHSKAGRIVRISRQQRGVSLRHLARELGLSAAFISDLELGRRHWSADRFKEAMAIIEKWRL